MKMRIAALTLFSLSFALPALGMTYKSAYPVPCNEVWSGVKNTLRNPDNYTVKENDDAKMHASCELKHSAYGNISEALLQRTNRSRFPKGTGCAMQVVWNHSGWEHNDPSDFNKRVDDAVLKLHTPNPAAPAKRRTPRNSLLARPQNSGTTGS